MRMFGKFPGLPALAAAAFAAAPLAAQDTVDEAAGSDLPDFENLSFNEALGIFRESDRRWVEEPCDFGAPLLGAMLGHQPDNPDVIYLSFYTRALCADNEKRYEDGAALVRELNNVEGRSADLSLTLYFARRTEDGQWALETLQNLEAEELGSLDPERFWFDIGPVFDAGLSEEFEALALHWFESNLIGFIDGDLYSPLAYRALSAAARDGRNDIAPQLLSYILSPRSYVDLLTMRKYEPLWPEIEARAGPNLTLVGAENVETTRRRLANAPSERKRFSDAAHALHFNGDFEEAIELADSWREREERGLELEEGDGWALNIQAYAYDSLGQPERADAVFDELAKVDPEENGWVVSFVINRASRLVGHGRWEEGLEAAQYARTVPGSTYAEMIVAYNHTCALNRLGRTEEALAELTFMRENRETSVAMLASALLCNGLRDEAAEVLIEGLRNEDTRGNAIETLLGPEADLFYTQSMLPDNRDLMAEYPELAAEFALHARDLPEAFTPRASQLRARLDLPEWED